VYSPLVKKNDQVLFNAMNLQCNEAMLFFSADNPAPGRLGSRALNPLLVMETSLGQRGSRPFLGSGCVIVSIPLDAKPEH
jgi:hypothetical protein